MGGITVFTRCLGLASAKEHIYLIAQYLHFINFICCRKIIKQFQEVKFLGCFLCVCFFVIVLLLTRDRHL